MGKYTGLFKTEIRADNGDLTSQYRTELEVDTDKNELQITTRVIGHIHERTESTEKISFTAGSFETVLRIVDFIHDNASVDRKSTVTESFPVTDFRRDSDPVHGNQESTEKSSEDVTVSVDGNSIVFADGESPCIYYNQHGYLATNNECGNLNDLLMLIKELKYGEYIPELPDDVKNELRNIKYGENVLRHLNEARFCYSNGMMSPTLHSYILAIEWAGIAYLKEKRDKDIINKEKNDGKRYYFHDILEDINKYFDVDQTTMEQLETVSNSMRHWMAHHKTGQPLPPEIQNLHDRTEKLIKNLHEE